MKNNLKNNLFHDNSSDDQQIVRKVIDYYHQDLKNKPQIIQFLTEKHWYSISSYRTKRCYKRKN